MATAMEIVSDDAKDPVVSIAVLIDELRNDEPQIRLNSVRKLGDIARALGPDRTREELIPYLNEFIDDEDDILLALAEELGKLIDLVGGKELSHCLLVPLETLCSVEESVVRDKAVQSITSIIEVLPAEQVHKYVVPLIKALAGGEWYTIRISAAALVPVAYVRVDDETKKVFRALFAALCRDETPMTRRAAATHFGTLAKSCEYEALKADLLVPFQKLAADDQDSVRLLTVENCVHLSKIFKPEDNLKHLVPVVYALCKDKSWRVRYMAADHFCSLYKAVGQLEMKDEDLVDCFVHLLQDNEAEVRTAASNKVTEVALLVGGNVTLNKLIVPCKSLVADSSEYVRAALAKVIMGIASVLGKKDVMDHLLPLFLQLLKDQNPEVRLNIISKLDSVNQVIGLELLSQSLVPAIVQLATDSKWRVRLAIINHIPLLAAQLGADFFEEKLNDLCMHWLGDQVYSIREAATLNLTKIAKVFGAQWSRVNILPKLVTLSSNTSYLFRMTSLNTIADLAPILGAELTTQGLLPVVVRMAGDAVPNVRFNVAKTLQAMLPHIPAKVLDSTVRPCLQKLASDKDVDVQYFATVALKAMQDVIASASH